MGRSLKSLWSPSADEDRKQEIIDRQVAEAIRTGYAARCGKEALDYLRRIGLVI